MKERTGFQTCVWGPPGWVFLHTLTFSYPEDPDVATKKHFRNFFKSLMHVLPCKYCRQSYASFCKSNSLKLSDDVFESRAKLSRWLYDIHDAVNMKLGYKDRPSFSKVKAMYMNFESNCLAKENEKVKGCVVPKGKARRLRTVVRVIPRECKLKGKTLKIYRKCLERYDL